MQALSQLSYGPLFKGAQYKWIAGAISTTIRDRTHQILKLVEDGR
jgi:hypothetical protein